MRDQVNKTRTVIEEQQVLLDKIKRVQRFFEHLETICNSIKEVCYYPSQLHCSSLTNVTDS